MCQLVSVSAIASNSPGATRVVTSDVSRGRTEGEGKGDKEGRESESERGGEKRRKEAGKILVGKILLAG